jgi:hypothetical protein
LDPLVALLRQLRSLPADGDVEPGLPRAADRQLRSSTEMELLDARALRQRIGLALAELGRRLTEELPHTFERALKAWDQIDALVVIDPPMRRELGLLRRAALALEAAEDAPTRAVGLESRLVLDAATGLTSLFERRLAQLVRARLRSDDPSLLVDGRPFVDLGAALTEAARRWGTTS